MRENESKRERMGMKGPECGERKYIQNISFLFLFLHEIKKIKGLLFETEKSVQRAMAVRRL